MYIKALYVIIDILVIIESLYVAVATGKLKPAYTKWLSHAMFAAITAVLGNILVAVSWSPTFAEVAYCIYFASIDWILYFLSSFCALYTEKYNLFRRHYFFTAILMGADSLSIFLNIPFGHQFTIYETVSGHGIVFYQTGFFFPYYAHLFIDYVLVIVSFILIIHKIVTTYSLYRIRYVMILSVLGLVIVLNIIYMVFSFPLDVSVIFYGIAGTLIYWGINSFIPKNLTNTTITRAVDDMNEGLILFDINRNLIYTNNCAKKFFDIDEETFSFCSEPVITVYNTLKECGESYGTVSYVQKATADKEERHYEVLYNKLTDKKGREIGSYLLVDDNTDQFIFTKELNEARIEADNANRAKSTFLANMSHEIRTPLNSILGMNEMILRNTTDPSLTEYAENVKNSGDILLSLINDILDFSKIEANKMEVFNRDFNPHDILNDCHDYFVQMTDTKDLYFKFRCSDNMPSVLNCDDSKIRQMLANIVSNAIKYTKEGGVTVEALYNETDHDRGELILKVTDTGIGIAEKDIPFLFDSFRRLNETQNATIQGTGLGLAITKEFAGLLNGDITVTSEPGKGSTFTLKIPVKAADNTPAGTFKFREKKKEAKVYNEHFRAPEAHVLVVDDVLVNIKVVTALLKKTEMQIDTATGGVAAIDLCNKNKYDIILLDHRMPEPDGIATFKVISTEGLNTDTPVICLTANALRGAELEYKAIGFSDYLSKPINFEALEEMLVKYLPDDKVIRPSD